MPENVPATQVGQKNDEKINFLIGGRHGSNADTMIFAQIDTKSRKIKLVSIPRDLFYNERKLNSYSTQQIKNHLEVITGFHIDHHMIIDMYAYIEVVDILGGIDLHLSQAVVDPTYKTLDNGVWSTMNYQPGWHHLSGTQSLRLARSRHTSSDFARAERQQKILKALKAKMESLKVSDGAQLLQIAQTILDKIETDLSLKEIVSYHLRYKNFEVEPRGVLSTSNVLISENHVSDQAQAAADRLCEIQRERDPQQACTRAQHQYTLIPRKSWNEVRWYVGELLKD